MLSAFNSFAFFMVIVLGTALAVVGLITVAHLFVQDMIDTHERRCHREDGKVPTSGSDGK